MSFCAVNFALYLIRFNERFLFFFTRNSDVDIEAQFSINQSRADEITMREDYGSLPLAINDEGFGDLGFDNVGNDFIRDGVDPNIDVGFQRFFHRTKIRFSTELFLHYFVA